MHFIAATIVSPLKFGQRQSLPWHKDTSTFTCRAGPGRCSLLVYASLATVVAAGYPIFFARLLALCHRFHIHPSQDSFSCISTPLCNAASHHVVSISHRDLATLGLDGTHPLPFHGGFSWTVDRFGATLPEPSMGYLSLWDPPRRDTLAR